jgi:hypothetical protein
MDTVTLFVIFVANSEKSINWIKIILIVINDKTTVNVVSAVKTAITIKVNHNAALESVKAVVIN